MAKNPSGLAGQGGGLGRAPGNEHTVHKAQYKTGSHALLHKPAGLLMICNYLKLSCLFAFLFIVPLPCLDCKCQEGSL